MRNLWRRIQINIIVIMISSATRVLPAYADPANSSKEIFCELEQCVKLPASRETTDITVAFSMKRDGTLLGKPKVTYFKFTGSSEARQAYIKDAFTSFAKCFPVRITDKLGAAAAGHKMYIRIRAMPHRNKN
jgi:hypothetical protein